VGFADLKKKLGIESSGHIQYHLNKLNDLVKTDEYGKYTLSDQGKDALLSVQTAERTAKLETKQNENSTDLKRHCFANRSRSTCFPVVGKFNSCSG
jgi:hypothetical protein